MQLTGSNSRIAAAGYQDSEEAAKKPLHVLDAAIEHSPDDKCLYSARSSAFAAVGEFTKAFQDALKAVKLDPTWWEGYLRMGAALMGLNEVEDAYAIYSHGILKSKQLEGTLEKLLAARVPVLQTIPLWSSNKASRKLLRFSKDAHRDAHAMRVFCISDIHVDTKGNIAWVQNLSRSNFKNDVILVAGDVGDTANAITVALKELRSRFRRVFYIPGNHDLWVRPDTGEDRQFQDSICKMFKLIDICEELDVDTGPAEVAKGVFIVPLFSWYSYTFDERDPVKGGVRFDRFCKWPVDADRDLWKYMLMLNKTRVKNYKQNPEDVCISMSHFLPRTELPFSTYVSELAKNVGCKELDAQVQALKSDVHVFGHTHINTDVPLRYSSSNPGHMQGDPRKTIRYVQYALENCGRSAPPYCLWDGAKLVGEAKR